VVDSVVFMNPMPGRKRRRDAGIGSRGMRAAILCLLPGVTLLSVFFLGMAPGGVSTWIHAHGPEGGHLHLLPSGIDDTVGGLGEWHGAHHRSEAEHEAEHHDGPRADPRDGHGARAHEDHGNPDEHEPAPEGVQLDLPVLLALAPKTPGGATTVGLPGLAAPLAPLRWCLAPSRSGHRPELARSGDPPPWSARSGVAALLRSSHALLI